MSSSDRSEGVRRLVAALPCLLWSVWVYFNNVSGNTAGPTINALGIAWPLYDLIGLVIAAVATFYISRCLPVAVAARRKKRLVALPILAWAVWVFARIVWNTSSVRPLDHDVRHTNRIRLRLGRILDRLYPDDLSTVEAKMNAAR